MKRRPKLVVRRSAMGNEAVGTREDEIGGKESRQREGKRHREASRDREQSRAIVSTQHREASSSRGREIETRNEEEAFDRDDDNVSDDCCDVIGDDDCDGDRTSDDEVVDKESVDEELCLAVIDEEEGSDADSGDFIWNDEMIPEPLSDSDEEDGSKSEIVTSNEDSDELLALGKIFNSSEDFKLAVLRYSLKTKYDIQFYRSQTMKIGAKCSDKKCPWRVYCAYEKRKQAMMIKVFIADHICTKTGYTKVLKISTIAYLFSERLRVNPKMTKQEMVYEIKREYNLGVTEDQCAKAKTKVMRERKASHEKHFAMIWDYQAEIFRSNRDTTFEIETFPGPTIGSKLRFHRLYICFDSQRRSWKETCRPIIGIDGAFLKWDIKGQLLAVVGRDGDNRIVPIAWGVVEVENETNWDWFLRLLAQDLALEDGRKVAVISDKQKVYVCVLDRVCVCVCVRSCVSIVCVFDRVY